MSPIDRFTNLARGVLSDSKKQFEADGGLEGAARRVGQRVRDVAESTRSAVQDGLAARTDADDPPLIDPALEAARREVADLKASAAAARAVSGARGGSASPTRLDGIAAELAKLDGRLRSGALSRAEWEAERARVLDAHDRSTAQTKARKRTL